MPKHEVEDGKKRGEREREEKIEAEKKGRREEGKSEALGIKVRVV